MSILILDDRADTLRHIEATFKRERLQHKTCSNIYKARTEWGTKNYNSIVTDLNMNPQGLEKRDIPLTAGALLTGWIWLIKYVFDDETSPIIGRTVIFSQYILDAEKIIFNEDNKDIYKPEIFHKVKCVPKARSADIGGLSGLVDVLKKK